jgi:hypothetical protein
MPERMGKGNCCKNKIKWNNSVFPYSLFSNEWIT